MSKHVCPKNISIISKGKIYTGCELDVHKIETGEYSAKFNREWQKKHYRKELSQPNEPQKFVKAFGADKAREYGYSEEQIRKYS